MSNVHKIMFLDVYVKYETFLINNQMVVLMMKQLD